LTSSRIDLSQRVPRSDVERFHVPGTDGGAHEAAELDPDRPSLRQLLRAMIEVSDNASADALLQRLGAGRVDAWARRQGLTRQDPIYPVLGEFAGWMRDPRWTQRTPRGRALVARKLAREVQAQDITLPSLDAQRVLADDSVAGAPAHWAQLMRAIARDGDRELVTALDWPRRNSASVARRFDRYLTKGGRQMGVITQAAYVRPAGKPGMAIALFLRNLPPDVEAVLAKTFSQQELITKLATDRAFMAQARRVLGAR
jgi:beta-lactamase class A